MAKKFIKTIYIPLRKYANDEVIPERIDLYETDCFVIYKTTTIENEVYERKDKKGTNWFEYSTAKEYLKIEFNQALCDEFQRQSKEYRKKANYNLQQNTAKKEAEHRMQVFTGALITEFGKFIGDWVKFNSKLHRKTEEIYQDFLKFMKDNNN